jgi:hypothetical protein
MTEQTATMPAGWPAIGADGARSVEAELAGAYGEAWPTIRRAVGRVADELADGDRARESAAGPWPAYAQQAEDRAYLARSLAYFVVSAVAEHDVCELDAALALARLHGRHLTADMPNVYAWRDVAYARAILAYLAGWPVWKCYVCGHESAVAA